MSLLRFRIRIHMSRVQATNSVDISVKHCSFFNISNVCHVFSSYSQSSINRKWRTDSCPSNGFCSSLATRRFLPWINMLCFSTFWQLPCCWLLTKLDPPFHLRIEYQFVANQRTVLFIGITFVCNSTTFINASWQSAGWPWWPVVPLLPDGIVNAASLKQIWFHCFRRSADLQIDTNCHKLMED